MLGKWVQLRARCGYARRRVRRNEPRDGFMPTIQPEIRDPGLLASLLAEDAFQPAEPRWTPLFPIDQQVAWTGVLPASGDSPQ